VTIKLRYITGRGGSATQGLSLYLSTLVNDYQGFANDSELHRLSVDEQVDIITEFCKPATHLIANSYGAYLWLLSRIDAAPSETRVLLLSPVMGRAIDPEKMLSSRPPRLKGLENAIDEKRLVLPKRVSVVTGKDDNVCDYQTAARQCAKLGINHITILDGEGHNLNHSSVDRAVRNFISLCETSTF